MRIEGCYGNSGTGNPEVLSQPVIREFQSNANTISGEFFGRLNQWKVDGDQDYLNLHEGAEFLHRVLWENRIPHEYHLVRGADHGGRTFGSRAKEAVTFLSLVVARPGPDPDPGLRGMRESWGPEKEKAESASPLRFGSRLIAGDEDRRLDTN